MRLTATCASLRNPIKSYLSTHVNIAAQPNQSRVTGTYEPTKPNEIRLTPT